MLSQDGGRACSTARCCTSPARAGSARRPSPLRSGWPPPPAAGATIVCEVAEQDRVSRAFAREGVQREQEVRARREPVGDHDRPHARRCGSGSARQLGGHGLRLIDALGGVRALRRRGARRQGADHDRQGLGARPARALGQPQPDLRPRGRRRAGLGARARDAHGAAHVRRDRARRAGPAPGVPRPRHARRPAPDGLRGRRAARRRCRSTRRSSWGRGCRGGRARARRRRRQRPVPGALLAAGRRTLRARPPTAAAAGARSGPR